MTSREGLAEELFQAGLKAEEQWKYEAALEFYWESVKLNPKAAGSWVNAATILYKQRKFVESEEHYFQALKADPLYPLAHFNLGNLYDEQGKIDAAIQCYEEAVRYNARYGDAHCNLALAYRRRGDKLKALKHFREFIRWGSGRHHLEIARDEIRKLRAELGMDEKVVALPIGVAVETTSTAESVEEAG